MSDAESTARQDNRGESKQGSAPPKEPVSTPATEEEILDRVKKSERWMIFLTAIVASTAVFQTVLSCNNNASTAKQVDRVISAADRIGDAANRFSTSAANINMGISSAVGKLGEQASVMDTARKSAEAASHLDQRPWLGFESISCDGCTVKYIGAQGPTNDDVKVTFRVDRFMGTLTNSGKTPAEGVRVDFVVTHGTRSNMMGRTTKEKGHLYDPAMIQVVSTPISGPRNQPTPLIGPNIDVPVVFLKNDTFNPGRFPRIPVIFVRGKITYTDHWHDSLETDFCIFAQAADDQTFPDQAVNGYTYCDEPNSNVMR